MAEVNEELLKEAIRKAAKEATESKDAAKKAGKGNAEDGAEYADREANATEGAEDPAGSANTAEGADAACDAADEPEEAAGDTEEASDDSENGDKKKKSLFGKKDKKDKKDEMIAELNDKILRNLAEFDNFRKRTEKEKSQMFEIGAKSIVEKILPTIDNFERGLATIPEDKKDDPFTQGMEKIYKQLMTSLEEVGVKPIEAVGKEFDPNLHNAVMHEDNEEFGENIISAEFQKGYMYRDSVVRHSMVKVAN